MFNLENKITWKELAPSLQAMFKTLQSQITDVKNEVNNINISLGDINDHLTQIDNDITNINENMTTIIRDTVEDVVGEMMFLNLAPKIGYYQEDKIEVISKYNMNSMKQYYIITHNNLNEEVLYFVGNDGSFKRETEVKIYKAKRTNQSTSFSFQNTEVIIPGLSYDTYKQFLLIASGDKYIILLAKSNFDIEGYDMSGADILMIKTYMLDNVNDWDIINLNFIKPSINSQFTYGDDNKVSYYSSSWLKYFYNFDKDILIVIGQRTYSSANVANDKNGNNFGIFSFKVSSQQFLHFTSLGSIFDYITAADGYSFDPNTENHDVRINNLNNNSEGWEPYRYYYFPEQEILRVLCIDKTINGYRVGSTTKIYSDIDITIVFGVPIFIWNGGTGTIIKYSKKEYGIGMSNPMYGCTAGYNTNNFACIRNYFIPCRYESGGYLYCCGYVGLRNNQSEQSYRGRCLVMKNSEQNKDSRGALYYANSIDHIIYADYTYPPDASLYGKAMMFGGGFNNKLYITANYKNPNSNPGSGKICNLSMLLGNSFQFKGTNGEGFKIINFTPGTYETAYRVQNDSITNPDTYVPGMYFNGNNGFGSTAESTPQYLNNQSSSQDGNYTFRCRKMEYKGKLKDGFASSLISEVKVNSLLNIFDVDYGITDFINSKYNPLGKYHIVFLQNRQQNNSTYKAYKGRVYFIVVEDNGTIHKFGEDFSSSWTTNWRNLLNSFRDNQYKMEVSALSYVVLTNRKMHISFNINNASLSNTYYCKNMIIEFNQDFSNFTMTDCNNANNNYDQGNISFMYSGDTIGLISCERKWEIYPLLIYTQKPLPGDTGTNHSVEDMLVNFNANKYAHYLESSQGLVAYIPSIPIFLGGYFSIIENPIPVTLQPNSDNYIYIERDSNDRTKIIASSSTTRTINEGDKVFNKILCAKVTTDSANMTAVEYYRINTGYNDYSFA